MAVGQEIITKIRSVENTQKITKAMQMVSTSKMRKTQERMLHARPYAEKIREVMRRLGTVDLAEDLPILAKRPEIKRACLILITTDKGLCGGLNANLLKIFFRQAQDYNQQGIGVDVVCLGAKGLAACQRVGLNVIASTVNLGDTPKLVTLLGALKIVFDRYEQQDIDIVHLMYSRFINTMKQEPANELFFTTVAQMFTAAGDKATAAAEQNYQRSYIFEPNAVEVVEFLIKRYLESVVYQAVCDSMASEQAARMVSMKAATDNAANAIKFLRLQYNKSRQTAITTELSEIVAGAAAV